MALGDLALLKVFILGPDARAQCQLGFRSNVPDSDWRELLAAEFLSQIMPDWMACLGFNLRHKATTVTDVVPGTAADVVVNYSPGLVGTGGTTEAPANCAYVISWRSDGIGRNTRGRNYLFGLPRLQISNATRWGSTAEANVQNLVEVILAQYGPTGFSSLARHEVISFGPHDAPLAEPQGFPVTHAVFGNHVRSMRKRLT
jgi:hypothetical protein